MIATMKVISIINLSIGGLAILACGFADEPLISLISGGVWFTNGLMTQLFFNKYAFTRKKQEE